MKDFIKTKKFALILSHQGPDGDSIGSSVSLSLYLDKIGLKNCIIFPDLYPNFYSSINGIENAIIASDNHVEVETLFEKSDLIFCLDFNHRSRLGSDLKLIFTKAINKYIFVIDHHTNPENFGDFEIIDTNASSTCELIFNFIESNNDLDLIDIPIAEAIYTGLVTDTGSFKYSSVSSNTHLIASKLKDIGLDHTEIHNNIFDQNSISKINLLGYALQKIKVDQHSSLAYLALSNEELKKFNYKKGDSEGFVNFCLSIKNINNAVFLREDKGLIKISFRSKGVVKVNEFSNKFYGGGGHENAAGAAVESTDLNSVTLKLIENFRSFCLD
ncbi:bifunctional oligoribonuclease/PAP phosphatase NrnA [Flavobacteriales bacterium]|nr:bifunctional oligoribonuclease/PAP phosphatase NrnA [Flavobacteriales bacterium]